MKGNCLYILDNVLAVDKWSSDRTLEETMLHSCMVGPMVPQHTLRHRSPNVLPTYENSADDLDNLDDVSFLLDKNLYLLNNN